VKTLTEDDTGWSRQVKFSPDDRRVAAVTNGIGARIWDVATGRLLATLELPEGQHWCVAWSPDGSRLATGGQYRDVLIWGTSTWQLRTAITTTGWRTQDLAYHPTEPRLAVANNAIVRLFDTQRYEEVISLQGHLDTIRALDFSPDGTTLLSEGEDGTVRLWTTKFTGGLELLRI
jgi:WD40 repeat protein